jgi:hypothetical protein
LNQSGSVLLTSDAMREFELHYEEVRRLPYQRGGDGRIRISRAAAEHLAENLKALRYTLHKCPHCHANFIARAKGRLPCPDCLDADRQRDRG